MTKTFENDIFPVQAVIMKDEPFDAIKERFTFMTDIPMMEEDLISDSCDLAYPVLDRENHDMLTTLVYIPSGIYPYEGDLEFTIEYVTHLGYHAAVTYYTMFGGMLNTADQEPMAFVTSYMTRCIMSCMVMPASDGTAGKPAGKMDIN